MAAIYIHIEYDLLTGISEDYSGENQTQQVKKDLMAAYKVHIEERLKAEIKGVDESSGQGSHLITRGKEDDKQFAHWPTTWTQQFRVLFKRGITERRHESFSGLRITQVLVVALICGLLWWQSNASNLQDKVTDLTIHPKFQLHNSACC